MKTTEKKKPINTVPDGVWEASKPQKGQKTSSTPDTDLQGNGYPIKKSSKK